MSGGSAHIGVHLLVKALDDELSGSERLTVEQHLATCRVCAREYGQLRSLSVRLESLVDMAYSGDLEAGRVRIDQAIREQSILDQAISDQSFAARTQGGLGIPSKTASRAITWTVWGMAVAALLAVGMILLPPPASERGSSPPAERKALLPPNISSPNISSPNISSPNISSPNIDVGDESFVRLPYSNNDLPVAATHVVRMSVPVNSLLDAGVTFEPISRLENTSDRSVLADVLVGIDGEPLGVHVLEADEE